MRFLPVLVLLGLATQSPATTPKKIDSKYLTVVTSTGQVTGGRVPLYLDITPKPKMHVYAPDKTQTYIPVALTIDAANGVKPLTSKFPPPEKYFFEPLKETQLVYSKPFRIVQEVTLPRASGTVTLTGTLRYQACDDKVCYIPQTVPVSWIVSAPPRVP
jgi:DsbC/DsbD-like thiol-disulfide interchange protein